MIKSAATRMRLPHVHASAPRPFRVPLARSAGLVDCGSRHRLRRRGGPRDCGPGAFAGLDGSTRPAAGPMPRPAGAWGGSGKC